MIKITIYFLSLFFFYSYSNEIDFDQLEYKDGLLSQTEINEIFTGDVTGIQNGKVVNGLKEGEWKGFYENGNLLWSGFYSKGLNVSKWIEYHNNGKVFTVGHYKNGKKLESGLFMIKKEKKLQKKFFITIRLQQKFINNSLKYFTFL